VKVLATLTVALSLLLVPLAGAKSQPSQAEQAIRYVFGPYASQALRVAWCESRFSIYATNGQYLGLFQMGNYARARYGHAWNAWAQAVSAYRYFVDSGKDWSPWSCKP
jgi:hypothetical protein